MFTPICESWHEAGWVAGEGLVEVENDGTTTLVLHNPGDLALHLREGDVHGKLQAVWKLPNVGEEEQNLDPVVGVVSGLGSGRGRVEELLDQLEVKDTQLPETEATQLRQVIEEYADVFALNDLELGVTDLVHHSINTGDTHQFHRTLVEMLSKTVERSGKDWDLKLPYVLFKYRTSVQESTQEWCSIFYMFGTHA